MWVDTHMGEPQWDFKASMGLRAWAVLLIQPWFVAECYLWVRVSPAQDLQGLPA